MRSKPKQIINLATVKILLAILAIFLLAILLYIPGFLLSAGIDYVTGWGNNFDDWAQVSVQSQVISLALIVAAVAALYLFLRKLNPKISLDAIARSISKNNTRLTVLLVAFGLTILMVAVYTIP